MAGVAKRPLDESVTPEEGTPPMKKLTLEPLRIGPVASMEDFDIQTLQFQHSKLKHRLIQRQKQEVDLMDRIEQLEKRQTQDDAVLNVINRYWNQLNEDIRILLHRFDVDNKEEADAKGDSEGTTSFLTQLSTWDKTELDEKLAQRVEVSKKVVTKIIQAFDRLQQRNEKATKALKGDLGDAHSLDDVIKDECVRIEEQNRSLVTFNKLLNDKLHVMGSEFSQLTETLTGEETKTEEVQNHMEDLEWEVNKLTSYNDKLTHHIHDLAEKYRRLFQMYGSEDNSKKERNVEISDGEVLNLRKEIEENREVASNRLAELEKLHKTQRETLKELEKLRMDIRQLPESVIVETSEYKCLQSKFSVIYNETLQLRGTLDESRNQLLTMRTNHLKQIEKMESEELLVQKRLRTEMIQLEDMLDLVRKEYESLRLEFEQNIAAHEQSGPINREMRHLIDSLQNHNQQLKGDVHRYRHKQKEMQNENMKLRKVREDLDGRIHAIEKEAAAAASAAEAANDGELSSSLATGLNEDPNLQTSSTGGSKSETEDATSGDTHETGEGVKVEGGVGMDSPVKKDVRKELRSLGHKVPFVPKPEAESTKELRTQLKKALSDQREMKLLLDMYKGASKDPRDKTQLMAAERKTRQDVEEVKEAIRKLQENKKDEKRRLADEEALRKIKSLEEAMHALQRQITNQKTEEDALVNEMEVTGQAFEDMQEQNARLIQQLREKDDANFKLMSDRVKSNQLQKLAQEERELLQEHVGTLSKQVEAENQVVRKLEEKERLLMNTVTSMEKEAGFRNQAMELHKRKAIESAQSAADLKLHLEKYHSQMMDAQQTVAEKTSALESEAYKTKRLQENIALLKRKVERLNKIEIAGNTDEVMMEEIREYKETLTCPSCKVKRKDAVLIKCFHVFCFDCLRTRYETRQRKCPKCNAAFGANDYHRLYLA